jgi:arsenate reductase (thioredoxin)
MPIRVLFVCTHNSARSQIAEALLQRDGGSDFEAHSAGSEATVVKPLTIQVLGELGIDWTDARSKTTETFRAQEFDYVVTVCDQARETCPYFPGAAHRSHWSIDDPSDVEGTEAERLAAFRATAVEIAARLVPFMTEAREVRGVGS